MPIARRVAGRTTRRRIWPAAWLGALLMGCSLASLGAVHLPALLSDHAVLQRGEPIPVWGWADAGERVTVTWRGRTHRTVTDGTGRWQVRLPAQNAGGPYVLEVRGTNTLRVQDVLVGEVWVCAGQSNMEFPLADSDDGARAVAAADHPRIRHVKIPRAVAFSPREDIDAAAWEPANPANAGRFSAVAYHFALRLERELGVPVGLINSSWGGTHIETWTSREALAGDADFAALMADLPDSPAELQARRAARLQALVARWQPGLPLTGERPPEGWSDVEHDDRAWPFLQAPGIWEEQGLPGLDGVVLMRRELHLDATQAAAPAVLALDMVDDCDETFVNARRVGGQCGWNAARRVALPAGLLRAGKNVIAVAVSDQGGGGGFHGDPAAMRLELDATAVSLAGPWRARVQGMPDRPQVGANDLPTLLSNAMLNPLTRTPVRGVLWYQGESNVSRAAQYARTLPLMMADWRRRWQRPGLYFCIVQLAAFLPVKDNRLDASPWAELRDAQRQAAALPHAGLVVTTDVGDANDIHPRNKRTVGHRLAGLVLHDLFGRPVLARGPAWRSMRVLGDRIELDFDHVGAGLVARGEAGTPLQGFAIAGSSGHFQPAHARIEGNRVIVHSPDVERPQAVRYGWVDNPEQANLTNRGGLPAVPFRTDNRPLATASAKYSP